MLNLPGRGAQSQPANPYLSTQLELDLAACAEDEELLAQLQRPVTRYFEDTSQTIVTENDSPDIPYRYGVNPYRGCAHGCSYCYARPYHEYLGLSAGVDFESKIFVKLRAAELFREWLSRPKWQPEQIVFSGVTDCYQPAERQFELTRQCLAVAAECRQPIAMITKNALVTRDLDLLSELASHHAVSVAISITSLDQELTRVLEPRTSAPQARLRAVCELSAAGVPVHVMVAPIIPGLNDSEVPAILAAAAEAGAASASFTVLRLPTTLQHIFVEWLERFRPNHAPKVLTLIREMRDGRLNITKFGERMRGAGPYAEQIAMTFRAFAKKHGLDRKIPALNAADFRPPRSGARQGWLF